MTANGKKNDAELDELLGVDAVRPLWRRALPWLLLAVVALAAIAAWQLRSGSADVGPRYVSEAVTRGALQVTVVANGTLAPTRAVSVGSELSGTVTRVLVDVNDRVKKGQLLVELDTSKLRDQISRSRATLASANARVVLAAATLKEVRSSLARMEEVARLSGGKVPSASELDSARASVDRAAAEEAVARASVADAQAALSADQTNLDKASIRSPIDGLVLTRAVDPGNAVAASLQAVTLFTLAEDLTRMKLEVNVDEADVGQVRDGQTATFTVSAWPNRNYPATITRVGYGSTTKDNVVTYLADLDVNNDDLSLRPGMTATASIAAAERHDVLLVPNAALRFTPTAVSAPARAAEGGSAGGIVSKLMPRPPRATPARKGTGNRGATAQVWVLRNGAPVAVAVSSGLSDGRVTEVSGDLREGEAVITDQLAGSTP